MCIRDSHMLAHRCEASNWSVVGQLAGDLGFLEAKCRELGVDELEADLARVAELSCRCGDDKVSSLLNCLARAVRRESHWLRDTPDALPAQLWNRLRRMGWRAEDLETRLRLSRRAEAFIRLRH